LRAWYPEHRHLFVETLSELKNQVADLDSLNRGPSLLDVQWPADPAEDYGRLWQLGLRPFRNRPQPFIATLVGARGHLDSELTRLEGLKQVEARQFDVLFMQILQGLGQDYKSTRPDLAKAANELAAIFNDTFFDAFCDKLETAGTGPLASPASPFSFEATQPL